MKPTSNWDRTPAQTGGAETLSAGGHQVRIKGAECRQSQNGHDMIVLYFDISEGSEYDGIMTRQYDRSKGFSGGNAKWPNMGTLYQLVTDQTGNTNPRFTGLITCIEQSNSGYRWDWNELGLKGKMLGIVFGEEEIIGQRDGKLHVIVKPRWVCEVGKALEQPVPALKKLPESDTNGYTPQQQTFTEVDDDELPFECRVSLPDSKRH